MSNQYSQQTQQQQQQQKQQQQQQHKLNDIDKNQGKDVDEIPREFNQLEKDNQELSTDSKSQVDGQINNINTDVRQNYKNMAQSFKKMEFSSRKRKMMEEDDETISRNYNGNEEIPVNGTIGINNAAEIAAAAAVANYNYQSNFKKIKATNWTHNQSDFTKNENNDSNEKESSSLNTNMNQNDSNLNTPSNIPNNDSNIDSNNNSNDNSTINSPKINVSKDKNQKSQALNNYIGTSSFGFGFANNSNSSSNNNLYPSSESLHQNSPVSPSFGFGSSNQDSNNSRSLSVSTNLMNDINSQTVNKQEEEIEIPTNISGEFRERGLSIPGSINGHSFDHFVRMLDVMNKEQLVSLIVELMKKDQNVQYHVASSIPRPTVDIVRRLLIRSEKEVSLAVPYRRTGPDRSSYAFNRVRSKIAELKDRIFYYLDFFVQPSSYPLEIKHEYPTMALSYLKLVTEIVHRLPTWDSEEHNQFCTKEIYQKLGLGWQMAIIELNRMIKEEGKMFDKYTVGTWASNLNEHCQQVQGLFGFSDAMNLFYKSLGWIIGVN